MPEPFTQLSQARGMWQAKGVSCQVAGDKRLPREQPVLPPEMVVGSAGSAWAQPTVDIGFTGSAAMTLLLMHEMTAITALGLWPGRGALGVVAAMAQVQRQYVGRPAPGAADLTCCGGRLGH